MAAFILYDDKYGFEPTATCSSAFEGAQKVHTWLGARFDPKKLQLWCDPTILSVTYDRNGMLLKNKPSRKVELEEEIGSILECQVFPRGTRGSSAASSCLERHSSGGKIWRAFLRSFSER